MKQHLRPSGARARALVPATLVSVLAATSLGAAPFAAGQNDPKPVPPAAPSTGKSTLKTVYPDLKGCSTSQRAWLRRAWAAAHLATRQAERLTTFVRSGSDAERRERWDRDFIAGDVDSPSPRRWFGRYDAGNLRFVDDAIDKAEARFRGKGTVKIKRLRCGSPRAPRADRNTDTCPASNPGGNGPPSAYHAPVRTIVTCPSFWNAARNPFVPEAERLEASARTLVHEVFHWLSVGGLYVTDYHGDGARGHKDQKYYGLDDANYLAERAPKWARRTNDNYAFFIRAVRRHAPTFSGVWADKDAGGTGALYFDMSWDGLVKRWQELGKQGQYLADVETYVRGGKRRYVGLWRVGSGNGALYQARWGDFSSTYGKLRSTQDLIDVEIFRSGTSWTYLGVYRAKPAGRAGSGGLLRNLSWKGLNDKRKQYAATAHLADVESYVDAGKRRYVGVWQVGAGGEALYQSTNAAAFDSAKQELDKTMQLVDFERFRTTDGKWYRLGIWRAAAAGRGAYGGLSLSAFVAKWQESAGNRTLIDVEEFSGLPARIP